MRGAWSIVLGVALVGCKNHDAPKRTESTPGATPGAAQVAAAPAPTSHTSPDRPALPDRPAPAAPGAGVPTAQQAFEADAPDPGWKLATEQKLRSQLAHLPHPPSQIDCRGSQCRITVVGSQQDVTAAVDELSGDRGLRGVADSMMLTAPEKLPDGRMALNAYARFDRGER